jgi:hypothetical protein
MFSKILCSLRPDLKILKSVFAKFSIFVLFWGSYFQTAYQIDAYDIPLKSYENCETFVYLPFSQILYSLGAELKIRKSVIHEVLHFRAVF